MTAPYYEDDRVTILAGDCLDVLATLPDASVDAVVTDPPYGLAEHKRKDVEAALLAWLTGDRTRVPTGRGGFMGKEWDRFVPPPAVWDECFRVLKPGGHLLAFAGSRTFDLMGMSIRLAGLTTDLSPEMRDSIAWIYGSGFPKSLDVSKAIDKANGRRFEDRYALGREIRACREAAGLTAAEVNAWFGYRDGCQHWERQDPSGARVPTPTDFATLRDRLGLSDEHLALVERIEAEREVTGSAAVPNGHAFAGSTYGGDSSGRVVDLTAPATDAARAWQGWGTALKPAFEPIVVARKPLVSTVAGNVLAHGTGALNVDGCRIEATDSQLAEKYASVQNAGARANSIYGTDDRDRAGAAPHAAGRWPANVVLDESQAAELDQQSGERPGMSSQRDLKESGRPGGFNDGGMRTPVGEREGFNDAGGASRFFYVAKAGTDERVRINGTAHPTVKPLALMRWLVRLVTPPGGVVLEPFAGSGTTVEACILEGFKCIAIEREADYLPLIMQRINRRRDPVAAVLAADPDDGGLFDLLDGESA